MRSRLAIISAALMIGGASTAYAQQMTGPDYAGEQRFVQGQGGQQFGQGQDQRWGGQQFGQDQRRQQFGQDQRRQQFGQGQRGQQFGQAAGTGRFQERANLRRELRQFGLQNIRILDAAYLVQARTRDGRPVIMVVDPPARMAGGMMGQGMMGQGQRSGQQFGGIYDAPSPNQISGGARTGTAAGAGTAQGQTWQGGQNWQGGQAQAGAQFEDDATAATGATGQTGSMDESQIRSMLRARGLSNIENLERDGNTYTASADYEGEQVDVRVNAQTGEITQPEEL